MTLRISNDGFGLPVSIDRPGGAQHIYLGLDEQRELLEALARMHGMSLVDREERRSLLALAEEVDDDPNDYSTGSEAWGAWQDRAEALASAVTSALRIEDPQEV